MRQVWAGLEDESGARRHNRRPRGAPSPGKTRGAAHKNQTPLVAIVHNVSRPATAGEGRDLLVFK